MSRIRGIGSSGILLGFLVLVLVFFWTQHHDFLSVSNINNVLTQATATAVAAVAMTYVILLADIDLSVGSTMNLAAVVAVTLGSSGGQFDTTTSWLAFPIGIAAGLACGLVNALLINRLNINALIVTLGTTSIYLGISLTITQAGTRVVGGTLADVVNLTAGPFSSVILVGVVIAAAGALFLKYRPNGRLLFAVGGDPRSARESGLSLGKARYIAFGFLGAAAAVSGLINVGQTGSVAANLGSDFAFTVITAVVIGGTSLFGGKGTVIGSVIGAVLLTTIDSGLNSINASIYVYDVIRGGILVLAMLSDSFTTRLSARRALTALRVA